MWDFEIGSVRQLENWLISRIYRNPQSMNTSRVMKRHKGLNRALLKEELGEFLKICSSIKNTLNLIPKLDQVYAKIKTGTSFFYS